MNAEELSDALGLLGGELVIEALSLIEAGMLTPEKQDGNLATYTKMIRKQDGRISLRERGAAEIERMIRAYYPWPGVSVAYEGSHMKLCKVSVSDYNSFNISDYVPGDVLKTGTEGIYVLTANGVLVIEELQLPGKNKVDAAAFLRGHKISKDSFNN